MTKNCLLTLVLILVPCFTSLNVFSQQTETQIFTIDSLFHMAIENNQALKLATEAVDVAKLQVDVMKQKHLPDISATLKAFYLGDATIYSSDFGDKTNIDMPHFGNSFVVQATQLVYKGNAVNNAIKISSLQRKLAQLKLEKNTQDIKLLIAGYYLELFRLQKQSQIYQKNIELSEIRLANITKMHEQGMVTVNDVIRTRLLLSNLKFSLIQLDDNIEIINQQLCISVGLPTHIKIAPDSSIITDKPIIQPLDFYTEEAALGNYNIRTSKKQQEIAERALAITKSDRTPALSLFVANSLQRPITTTSPVLDKYSNGWQAGISLSYNLSALYKTPKNIEVSKMQLLQAQDNVLYQNQNTWLEINAAYLKHAEAKTLWETTTLNKELALENYKRTETKYLNQLVLLIDMLDATNSKLESELQQTSAEINILFTYFKLLNICGKL